MSAKHGKKKKKSGILLVILLLLIGAAVPQRIAGHGAHKNEFRFRVQGPFLFDDAADPGFEIVCAHPQIVHAVGDDEQIVSGCQPGAFDDAGLGAAGPSDGAVGEGNVGAEFGFEALGKLIGIGRRKGGRPYIFRRVVAFGDAVADQADGQEAGAFFEFCASSGQLSRCQSRAFGENASRNGLIVDHRLMAGKEMAVVKEKQFAVRSPGNRIGAGGRVDLCRGGIREKTCFKKAADPGVRHRCHEVAAGGVVKVDAFGIHLLQNRIVHLKDLSGGEKETAGLFA